MNIMKSLLENDLFFSSILSNFESISCSVLLQSMLENVLSTCIIFFNSLLIIRTCKLRIHA